MMSHLPDSPGKEELLGAYSMSKQAHNLFRVQSQPGSSGWASSSKSSALSAPPSYCSPQRDMPKASRRERGALTGAEELRLG